MTLSVRKGTSQTRDASIAARELYEAIHQPDIKLAVFYCAADFDLPVLAHELHRLFGDVNLIGCTSAGEITPRGYLAGSLTGFSIAGDRLDAAVDMISLAPFDADEVQGAVRRQLASLGQQDGLLPSPIDTFAFMLIDGMSMREELVASTVHQALHGIELVGGSAADDVHFAAAWLYYRGKFQQNVALLSVVRSDLPFLAFRTQHFVKSDQRMVVTRADPARRIVHEINGVPAGREYARLLGMQITELTPLIFATHPVVVRVGGQYFVRAIAKVDPDESMTFYCAIDEGIVLATSKGMDMVQNLKDAFDKVRTAIGEPQLVLGCDCMLRRMETERDGIKDEIGAIFTANNVVGFATFGEQFNSMHVNQTFAGIAIGK